MDDMTNKWRKMNMKVPVPVPVAKKDRSHDAEVRLLIHILMTATAL